MRVGACAVTARTGSVWPRRGRRGRTPRASRRLHKRPREGRKRSFGSAYCGGACRLIRWWRPKASVRSTHRQPAHSPGTSARRRMSPAPNVHDRSGSVPRRPYADHAVQPRAVRAPAHRDRRRRTAAAGWTGVRARPHDARHARRVGGVGLGQRRRRDGRCRGSAAACRRRIRAIPCGASFSTEAEVEGYYLGFANSSLWPLCHLLVQHFEYRGEYWERYRSVNEKFAHAVADEVLRAGRSPWSGSRITTSGLVRRAVAGDQHAAVHRPVLAHPVSARRHPAPAADAGRTRAAARHAGKRSARVPHRALRAEFPRLRGRVHPRGGHRRRELVVHFEDGRSRWRHSRSA